MGSPPVVADSETYSMNVMVMANPAASALKNSSRLPEVISSSAAAMMRWKISFDVKRSRTTEPTAGAPLRERSMASRTDSSGSGASADAKSAFCSGGSASGPGGAPVSSPSVIVGASAAAP